ncbi:threonine synthase [Alphaproteobacteria bacterium]|nr:threonine synthase [Alphaproteobacteria bacterium]
MEYISTRGENNNTQFEGALLNGLARDGGLYLPKTWPKFTYSEIEEMRDLAYYQIAGRVISKFTEGDLDINQVTQIAKESYENFTHPDVAPLTQLEDGLYALELFHGPTIAFKDYAMQFLARAFQKALATTGRHSVILGATSGDTGSAALQAFQNLDSVDIFILFPNGRVSPIQQKQMTSLAGVGAYAVCVTGDFDTCQDIVKACFNDHSFRDDVNLSAINSINWARLVPQIVYYFTSALKLGAPQQEVAFSVPTGNFGNIFAGWAAKQMGLPIQKLIIASNKNDILTRFFGAGKMQRATVEKSLSPSMDIQVSSNFERLLFELLGRDAELCAQKMSEFETTGSFDISAQILTAAKQTFVAYRADDAQTLQTIKSLYDKGAGVFDPHSAVGLFAASKAREDKLISADVPIISLICAHPAKFPDAVEKAISSRSELPEHLRDLMGRPETKIDIEGTVNAVQNLINKNMR